MYISNHCPFLSLGYEAAKCHNLTGEYQNILSFHKQPLTLSYLLNSSVMLMSLHYLTLMHSNSN